MEIGTARRVSFMLVTDHNTTCMHISLQPENTGGDQSSRSDSTNGLKFAKHHIMLSSVFSSSSWCTEASPVIIALLISELDFSVDRVTPIQLIGSSHTSSCIINLVHPALSLTFNSSSSFFVLLALVAFQLAFPFLHLSAQTFTEGCRGGRDG